MSRSTSAPLALLLLSVLLPVRAAAQQPLPELSLEDLMSMDAGQVFGASERLQPVTEAPASVSFITADEIARFGYRTLADVLRGVRGMYVTDDRNFSFLGTRGFGKPGDYNSRILLLVNGHRVNDNVFGQAEIGAEFGLDPATFERVEIIRGPASSLYGDSAFFAVVNVITRTGASLDGLTITAEVGTLDTQLTRATAGRRFANGLDVAVAGTFGRSGGMDRLYFPAFDSPETNNGVAVGLDGEQFGQVYGRVSFGDVTLTGAYGSRRKDIPTASFNTLFNEQEFREQSTDRHTLIDAEYGHTYGANRVAVRASFDRFTYDGTYPFARADGSPAPWLGRNAAIGTRWSAGTRLTRPLPGRQVLTVGAEFINNLQQDQTSLFEDPFQQVLDIRRSSLQHALYLQDEIRFAPWLIVNAGLRYDGYEEFVRVTPRTALIVMPSANQSFKYLFGSAFRAPNEYELNSVYFGEGVAALRPEAIDTHELVWERYTNDWLRTSVSTYWYKADRLITLVATDDTTAFTGVTFVNQRQVRARGLELEAQMRLRPGWQAMTSYALQRAIDEDTGAPLTNSPRHVAKARLSLPAFTEGSSLGAEVLFFSSRLTLAGNTLKPAATAHVTWLQPLGRSLELVGSVRNIFDAENADPASDQHRQDSIPWNGRTARIGLQWKIGQR